MRLFRLPLIELDEVYEFSAEGGLSATISFQMGGTPRRFESKREGSKIRCVPVETRTAADPRLVPGGGRTRQTPKRESHVRAPIAESTVRRISLATTVERRMTGQCARDEVLFQPRPTAPWSGGQWGERSRADLPSQSRVPAAS